MRLVTWIWFWYILIGFLMGGGAAMIWNTLKKLNIKLVWYEWILLILSFITFMFMGQTFIASFQEYEPRAAWFTLVFMGIPILIMAVILYRSVNKRFQRKKEIGG